jgi:hypothetical protein
MFVSHIKYNGAPRAMITPFIANRARVMCHPDSYTRAIEEIQVHVGWTRSNTLAFTYALSGDLMHLRIPALQAPRRADGLWRHTCFEAFVCVTGRAEYYEFNFAPSGEWAAYSFRAYRDGESLKNEELIYDITVRSQACRLDLDAIVRLDRLLTTPPRAHLRLALSAVIEEKDGGLSYWALKHPPGKPDFHHPDAFAMELALPELDAANASTMAKR